ncbi:hypothetical protein AMC90_PA00078 (plasmid) [Rhizobium phaseoli]|uniref:Uncharacterized protein n=1 Tax=Rhizobium phaseoli TaxID=396 RepID=A0ABM6CLB5_9HYPH|nr:hypothetical protein AMC90_PA00078 [Rhizobium phaseoli]ANL89152.1 hypothetical protein AMC81_PE00909 [Rhizobium phaseoli]ANL95661.1 hypothetical protein AMC80_PE00909 [Rhizobium phaseoli]
MRWRSWLTDLARGLPVRMLRYRRDLWIFVARLRSGESRMVRRGDACDVADDAVHPRGRSLGILRPSMPSSTNFSTLMAMQRELTQLDQKEPEQIERFREDHTSAD